MAAETIGPTFRTVILALAGVGAGGGAVAAAGAVGTKIDPERISALESDVKSIKATEDARERRLERIESKLDRLIERK